MCVCMCVRIALLIPYRFVPSLQSLRVHISSSCNIDKRRVPSAHTTKNWEFPNHIISNVRRIGLVCRLAAASAVTTRSIATISRAKLCDCTIPWMYLEQVTSPAYNTIDQMPFHGQNWIISLLDYRFLVSSLSLMLPPSLARSTRSLTISFLLNAQVAACLTVLRFARQYGAHWYQYYSPQSPHNVLTQLPIEMVHKITMLILFDPKGVY